MTPEHLGDIQRAITATVGPIVRDLADRVAKVQRRLARLEQDAAARGTRYALTSNGHGHPGEHP